MSVCRVPITMFILQCCLQQCDAACTACREQATLEDLFMVCPHVAAAQFDAVCIFACSGQRVLCAEHKHCSCTQSLTKHLLMRALVLKVVSCRAMYVDCLAVLYLYLYFSNFTFCHLAMSGWLRLPTRLQAQRPQPWRVTPQA